MHVRLQRRAAKAWTPTQGGKKIEADDFGDKHPGKLRIDVDKNKAQRS